MNTKLFSGKYEIQGEIARGGMGIIYKAIHTTLNRIVAIKVLHPQYSGDSAFLKRFQREARAMARLDHENIIRVFDVAEDHGSYYIVMEYFNGKDLKQLILEKGRIVPQEALTIAIQLTNALAYAHAQGIIHRDIKPGNIMNDSRGRVKIADFGIAAATDEISVTATGQIIGTPEYMSPEQARGETLDGRTDLYSLGMVIYEMLNGQTPYQGISRMAIVGKLLYEQEEFTPPFPAEIPTSLQDLVWSLLKRQRQNRIESASILINQIIKVGSDMDVDLRPGPSSGPVNTSQPIAVPLGEEGPTVMLGETPTGTPPPISQASAGTPSYSAPFAQPISQPIPQPIPSSKRDIPSAPVQQVKPRVKVRGLIPFIIGVVGVLILVGGVLYYLSSIEEKPSSVSTPDQKAVEGSISLTEVREIQIAVREMQERLSAARSDADGSNTKKWAPEIYQQAVDNETEASQALQAGASLINQSRYNGAKASLQQALGLLSQARDGYVQVRETAVAKAAEEQKTKAEQVKLKKLRAEQERLERAKSEAKKTERTPQKQESQNKVAAKKVPAPSVSIPPTQDDIKEVQEILSKLKKAYENKDMRALAQMSEMSDGRVRFLQQIFREYSSINLTYTDFSITGQSASAIVLISSLVDHTGNLVTPGAKWRQTKVVIKKQGNQWGKVVW
jgi:serine/threonine protein kinase